eukprot:GFUD01031791.1.p1 GENE.GFUD01031791.1~~GFUD01031791.1.p1  ORF type:complete len:1095 (-),score=194.32 GFUD01031791.1:125-3385(-)
MLVERNATVDTPDINGVTPLLIASHNGHVDVINILLTTDRGKQSLNTPMNTGATPLLWAAFLNHSDVVRTLLQHNETDVNKHNNKGETPVFAAAFKGHGEIVKMLLLDNGAKFANFRGNPMLHARKNGFVDLVNTLLDSVPEETIGQSEARKYNSMTLNLDSRERGVVVMISWGDRIQVRFKLDSQLRGFLKANSIDPDTWTFGSSGGLDNQFINIADFRALILIKVSQSKNTTSCPSKTESCVKVSDVFNLIHETLQNLYNLYTAYLPVLHTIYPQNSVLHHLYTHPVIYSVMLPVCWLAAILLVVIPCCFLLREFLKYSKGKEIEDIPLGSISSEVFRDRCPCATEESTNDQTKKQTMKEDKTQCLMKWGLVIFSISLIVLYPYALKLIKSLLQFIIKDDLKHSKHSWPGVVYKFLGLFFFDTKYGQLSSWSELSNPFVTGFYALDKNRTEWFGLKQDRDLYDEYLPIEKEKFSVFSAGLSSSSLSLSFSILFHLISIYFMLQYNIFKKFRQQWDSRRLQSQGAIIIIILICLAINISRYFMCINSSNGWILFLLRLIMISICTPSSIVLEWICFRLYQHYLAVFRYRLYQLLSYGSPNLHSKDKVLSDYLSRGYLGHAQLSEWKTSVAGYTTVIGSLLEQRTGHHFTAIDTGSIVERFGVPLGSDNGLDDLQTDHDVMFVATDVLVSDQEGRSALMVPKDGSLEYVYLESQNPGCSLMENITRREDKIDTMKAKNLLNTIVTNVSIRDFGIASHALKMRTLLSLSCLTLTQRLVRWNRIHTNIMGPAINFKVKTAHLNPSWLSKDEWVRQMDCDFILAFHLDHWPHVAREWVTRHRSWPSREDVDRIVSIGCEVVPKVGFGQDTFGWRLSFSQVERLLSGNVGEKARKTYLAVKIFVKRNLKNICPFLKTYHIKTVFFYNMETKTGEYWEDTDMEKTIRDFLKTLSSTMRSGHCPHYFFPSVDLWGKQIIGESVTNVPIQAKRGCQLIEKVIVRNISDLIIPLDVQSQNILQTVFAARSFKFYTTATVLVLVTELLLMASLPVLGLCLAVFIQKFVSWLIGMVGCLPFILPFIGIMLALKKCF